MTGVVRIKSLGVPAITDEAGRPLALKTRKALAVLIFLLRSPGQTSPREVLADFFWSESPRDKAAQSLRQALRHLRHLEEVSGVSFLAAGQLHVSIRGEAFAWDVPEIEDRIRRGTLEDYAQAVHLWQGEFLTGFEALDREFTNWLLIERERLRTQLISVVFDRIGGLAADPEVDGEIEAGARFLLHLDKALEPAHQVLIRLYLARGQDQRALQQLKACERELRASLDAEPEPATYRLFDAAAADGPAGGGASRPVAELSRAAGAAPIENDFRLPEISILSLSLNQSSDAMARRLRDDIVGGLSAYRCFDLLQAEYQGTAAEISVTRVDGGELGSYLLRFRHDAPADKVYIQFEDRDSGRILFNEIVDFQLRPEASEAQAAALQTIVRIRNHVVGRLRRPGAVSAIARWCQAEALIWEFSPAADKKALQILAELERSHPTFALTYAGQASIHMKRQLYYPNEAALPGLAVRDVLLSAERSVLLDPWQPVGQRVYGWALVQAGFGDEARKAFHQAEKLNPYDPNNLMSVAEGLAFAGDINAARKISGRAFSLFPSVPRILYEYMANVHFAAEDYTAAAEYIERAPPGSIFGLTTRVAALVCTGQEAEAVNVLRKLGNTFAPIVDRSALDRSDRPSWHQRVNFFQDPVIRANYQRGADLVHRYMTGSL